MKFMLAALPLVLDLAVLAAVINNNDNANEEVRRDPTLAQIYATYSRFDDLAVLFSANGKSYVTFSEPDLSDDLSRVIIDHENESVHLSVYEDDETDEGVRRVLTLAQIYAKYSRFDGLAVRFTANGEPYATFNGSGPLDNLSNTVSEK